MPALRRGRDDASAAHAAETRARIDANLQAQRFARALSDIVAKRPETVVSGPARELLGPELASALDWEDLLIVRLPGSNSELAGLLCLSGRSQPLAAEDRELLEAIAGHAAMALENARLFTRIEQANRHWLEIFDAMTDLIIVHERR